MECKWGDGALSAKNLRNEFNEKYCFRSVFPWEGDKGSGRRRRPGTASPLKQESQTPDIISGELKTETRYVYKQQLLTFEYILFFANLKKKNTSIGPSYQRITNLEKQNRIMVSFSTKYFV